MSEKKAPSCPTLRRKLQSIHGRISLKEGDKRRNNRILQEFLRFLITFLRKDSYFNAWYNKMYHGGSYYDNSKILDPDEYDLDMVMKIPKPLKPELQPSTNHPGFVQIKLVKLKEYIKRRNVLENVSEKFLEDGLYLSSKKVKEWFANLVVQALEDWNYRFKSKTLGIIHVEVLKEGGPGITLQLNRDTNGKKVKLFDVDLVPSITFKIWPDDFRSNKTEKNEFLAVPKPPGGLSKYWRLSFQDQEKELLTDVKPLKPVTRLLKKLRDQWEHKEITSYMIKTILLWSLESDKNIWSKSLEVVFLEMLRKYHEALESPRNIPYYWFKSQNLLEYISETTLSAYAENVRKLIEVIEQGINRKPVFKRVCLGRRPPNKKRKSPSNGLYVVDENNNNPDTPSLYVRVPPHRRASSWRSINESFGVDSQDGTNRAGADQKRSKKTTRRKPRCPGQPN